MWEKLKEAIDALVTKGQLELSHARDSFGLSRCKVCISAAAPMHREVLEFFKSNDILILEMYGMSESTGPTAFNTFTAWKITSVGKPMLGVRVKIYCPDENGEGEVGHLVIIEHAV